MLSNFSKYITGVLVVFTLLVPVVHAQEEGTLFSELDIQNAQILSQEGNDIEVFFEFVNGKVSQSDIHYSVRMWSTDSDPVLVNEYKAEEKLVFAPEESSHMYASFTAPTWLNGEFLVEVTSFTSDGFPLARVPAGFVTLEGSGEYLKITSCELAVDGNVLSPNELIVIRPSEEASFTCAVENLFADAVSASFVTLVHQSSIFGEGVGAFPEEEMMFEAGEERRVSFFVPKQESIGSYEHTVFFETNDGIVSNRVFYAYNTATPELQIVNGTTDKNAYEKDEEIKVQVFVLGNISEGAQGTLDVFSANNNSCLENPAVFTVSPDQTKVDISANVKKSCNNGSVSVILSSTDGRMLDEATFLLGSGADPENGDTLLRYLLVLGVAVILILILILIYVLMFHNKKQENITLGIIIAGLILTAGMLFPVSVAEATTWTKRSGACGSSVTGSVNGSTFNAGSSIGTYGRSHVWCTGSGAAGGGLVPTSISTSGSSGTTPVAGGSVTLRAPSSGGNYSVTFRADIPGYPQASGSIGYRVIGATPPAPSASLSASPSSITRGNSSRLSWSSSNATSCSGSGFSTGGRTSGSTSVSPTSSRTYTVTCTAGGRSASDSARVTVNQPNPAASASLSASPSSITRGNSSRLSWSSSNATSCSGSGFSTSGRTSGSTYVSPSSSTTYSVTCSGSGGSDSDSARVTVGAPPPPAPSASLSASPSSITRGNSSRLSWSSSNATSCSGSGFSTGGSTSGSRNVSPSSTTTYTVTCSGSGGTDSDTARVTVSAPPSPPAAPTASIEVRNTTQGGSWTGSNIIITAEDQISLRWSSSNASSCSGSNFSTGGSTSGTQSSVSEPSAGNQRVYTVSCSGSGGTGSDSLRVTVQAQDPSLSASASDVRFGESATISYNMQGNDPSQCSLVGPGVSYLAGSFTQQTGNIAATISGDSTFTLTCAGGSAEITIELIPDIFDS